MERDPQKDLELCRRATPGPWVVDVIQQYVTFGLDNKCVYFRCAGPVHSAPRSRTKAAEAERKIARSLAEADGDLVTVAKEALEYWINETLRLRWMIQYVLDGPNDVAALKNVLEDALDGVTGADNKAEVHGERDRLRAECERLTAALRALDDELTKTRERETRYSKALERVCATCAAQDPDCDEDECSDCDVWRALHPEEEGERGE